MHVAAREVHECAAFRSRCTHVDAKLCRLYLNLPICRFHVALPVDDDSGMVVFHVESVGTPGERKRVNITQGREHGEFRDQPVS